MYILLYYTYCIFWINEKSILSKADVSCYVNFKTILQYNYGAFKNYWIVWLIWYYSCNKMQCNPNMGFLFFSRKKIKPFVIYCIGLMRIK